VDNLADRYEKAEEAIKTLKQEEDQDMRNTT